MRPALVHRATILVLVVAVLPAGAWAVPGQSVELTTGVSTSYVDNVLQYSSNQVTDFDAGLHPFRYSIESAGDAVLLPSLALTWRLDEGGGRSHAVRVRGEGDFHARNGTADDRSTSIRWSESFSHRRRLTLGYFRLDDFYVRQLRDEDLAALGDLRYRRAQFDLQIASASWRNALGRTVAGGVAYQYEDRRYVPEFRERDSWTHQGEVRLDWTGRRRAVGARVGFRTSDARASDGDEVAGVPDDDDLSYAGAVAGLEGKMELRRAERWRLGCDLAYELGTRSYQSTRPADAYHFGRDDLLNAVEIGLRFGYGPHLALRTFYHLEDNRAHLGTSAPPTSDSGSYRVNQLGMSVEWAGDLWRHGGDDGE